MKTLFALSLWCFVCSHANAEANFAPLHARPIPLGDSEPVEVPNLTRVAGLPSTAVSRKSGKATPESARLVLFCNEPAWALRSLSSPWVKEGDVVINAGYSRLPAYEPPATVTSVDVDEALRKKVEELSQEIANAEWLMAEAKKYPTMEAERRRRLSNYFKDKSVVGSVLGVLSGHAGMSMIFEAKARNENFEEAWQLLQKAPQTLREMEEKSRKPTFDAVRTQIAAKKDKGKVIVVLDRCPEKDSEFEAWIALFKELNLNTHHLALFDPERGWPELPAGSPEIKKLEVPVVEPLTPLPTTDTFIQREQAPKKAFNPSDSLPPAIPKSTP